MTVQARNTLEKTSASWLQLRSPPADPVAKLSDALGSGWSIQRQADYMGEVSIIALPAGDNDVTAPTFILYEKGGLAHLGIVREDEWETDRIFPTIAQAVTAIITEVTTSLRQAAGQKGAVQPEGK